MKDNRIWDTERRAHWRRVGHVAAVLAGGLALLWVVVEAVVWAVLP